MAILCLFRIRKKKKHIAVKVTLGLESECQQSLVECSRHRFCEQSRGNYEQE